MDQQQPLADNRRFGKYLRKIREDRRLSLDVVEEMSLGLPERVTKSHLSRIENGRAIPSFPRMFTLSQIYGVPVSAMAERFELCLKAEMYPHEARSQSIDDVLEKANRLRQAGRYAEALVLCDSLLERVEEQPGRVRPQNLVDIRLHRITCLMKLAREVTAKEECEKLLNQAGLTARQEFAALYGLAQSCQRLGNFTVAMMVADKAEAQLPQLKEPDRHSALLAQLKGDLYAYTGRFDEAADAYWRALKIYEELSDQFYICKTTLNFAACVIELGRTKQARRQLQQVLKLTEAAGYDRQHAYALSHLALLAYREQDFERAEAYCLRSNRFARSRDYTTPLFRNCFYLWRISQLRNDEAGIKTNERTLRTYLNRVESFMPEAEEFRAFLGGGKDE